MSFLLDTDICSAFLKSHPLAVKRFLHYTGGLHISTVTLGELYTWAMRAKAPPRRLQDLLEFVKDTEVLVISPEVARKFGELRAALFDAGTPGPEMDLFNGTVALVHNLTLVTHNTADYANIPGLTFVDWLIP